MMDVRPVTLTGVVVRLEPLGQEHAEGLYAVGHEPHIWRHLPEDPSDSLAEVRTWIGAALRERASGTQLPFAIVESSSGLPIGSTRYTNISVRDRGLEIGWTWLAARVRRTRVNTECKYLLLRHAFEALRAVRVQLKADVRNDISQRAIERLGAVREGVLRKHMLVHHGYIRDSVMYSILDSEWPAVKTHLEGFLTV